MSLYVALLYKEWIKLRWLLLLLLVIVGWVVGDMFLSLRRLFEFVDPMKIWMSAIQRKEIFYSGLEYLPLAAGVSIALAQFVPETMGRRLRLLFHLPLGHHRAIYTMVVAGLVATGVVIALCTAGLLTVLPAFFPEEVVASALSTSTPWFLGGLVAYLSTVLVVLEPSWRRKLVWAALAWSLVGFYFEGRGYCAYDLSLGRYAAIAVLLSVTATLPAVRFKRGLY
jgi:hypothetical protein